MRRLSRSFLATLSLVVAFFFLLLMFMLVPEPFDRDRLVAWHFALFCFLVFQPLVYQVMNEALCRQAEDLYKFRFSLKTAESPIFDRVLTIFVMVLTSLVPIFRLSSSPVPVVVGGVAAWIVVTEVFLRLSSRIARADFQHDVVLVRGFNFRKYYGLNSKSVSVNGIYLYEEFESFSLKGELLTLNLSGTGGNLRLKLPANIAEPVAAYLLQGKSIKRLY
jgi:hypothetical protein